MKPYETFTGVVLPMDRTNIDTDAIIPKQFLKRIERTGFGQFLFYEFRFDENGNPIKDSIFNQERYKNASVLLGRANFGCGSSREHAPWALSDYGIKVIIAPSFADIFYNNSFNNGLLPIRLDSELVDQLFKKTFSQENYRLTIDLDTQKIYDSDGLVISFEIDPFRREKLLKGLDDIALTLLHEDSISAYESQH